MGQRSDEERRLDRAKKFKNKFRGKHPMANEENHERLLQHIKDRLTFGAFNRVNFVEKLRTIDRDVAGYMQLDEEDRKRMRDNKRGYGPKPTKMRLSLTYTQLDELVTFLLDVFVPTSDMFSAIAAPDKQAIANGFALKMNKDAEKYGYFSHYSRVFFDNLKYNAGGMVVCWEQTWGNRVINGPQGTPEVKNEVVWAGNRVIPIDMYNVIWDIAVPLTEVNRRGEFFATVTMNRKFKILKMAQDGELFDIHKIEDVSANTCAWYQVKPTIRIDYPDGEGSASGSVTGTDWISYMTAGASNEVTQGVELVNYYGWICPKDFGLSDVEEMEIWRIVVMNNQFIGNCVRLDNAHGLLPCAFAAPNDVGLDMQEKSHAELLMPLEQFASFSINVHQDASRKALYGITLFDPTIVDMTTIPAGEVAPRIPVRPQGMDVDIRKHFWQFYDAPRTENTMNDVSQTMQLMQKLVPTDQLKQVADLQRATQYQAAATVQGGNRRNKKIAKMIDSQMMVHVRHMMMYNVMQKQEPITIIDDQTGQSIEVDPTNFRGLDIEFLMAEGLKAIDKIILIDYIKEILMACLQSQAAIQRVDILKLMNYLTDLMGDKTDLSQFMVRDVLDQLPPEIRQALGALLQSGQINEALQATMQQMQPQQALPPAAAS